MKDVKSVSKTIFCSKPGLKVKMIGTYVLEPRREDKPDGKVYYVWRLQYIENNCPYLKDGNCYNGHDCIANDQFAEMLPQ